MPAKMPLKMLSAQFVCRTFLLTLWTNKSIETNSVDPDQIAPVSLKNSVDPDQTARSSLILVNTICQKQSDLGPQCLSKREISANNTEDAL